MRLQLSSMVCDAPARAFVKNVIGPRLLGVWECMQEGNMWAIGWYSLKLMPSSAQELQRNGWWRASSRATSLGMVSGFPLDYMHLVCLGVMRRILYLWLKGPLACRLSGFQVKMLSKKLFKIKTSVPVECARRPRSLKEVNRWKALEFRHSCFRHCLRSTLSMEMRLSYCLFSTLGSCMVRCTSLTMFTTLCILHKTSRCMGTWTPAVPSSMNILCKS